MLKNLLFKISAVAMLVGMTNYAIGQGNTCDMAEVVTAGSYTLADTITAGGNTQADAMTGAVWYSYTPAESGIITVSSCLGGADTRLFIWTGACDALTFVAGNDDACDLQDGGPAYASGVAGVPVAAGVAYLIEWDDRWSNAAFTWGIEFTPLPPVDVVGGAAAPLDYTRVPDSQQPIALDGVLGNGGSSPLTGAVLTVTVTDASGATVTTESSMAQDLAVGQVVAVPFTPFIAPVQGDYTIEYSVSANEMEEEAEQANNVQTLPVLPIKKTYARDRVLTGTLGNPDSEITQGQNFTFVSDDTISSITFFYANGDADELIEAIIYNVDPATGTPTDIVATQAAPAGQGWVTVVFDTEVPVVAGATHFIGLHSTTVANIALGTDNTNFYPGEAWLLLDVINDGNWTNPEAVSANFQLSYAVRPNMKGDAMYDLTLAVDMANETVSADGVHVAGNFNGWDAGATEMTDDDGDGVYTVTVSVPQIMTVEYKFINGTDFAMEEAVPGECGVDNGLGGFNRAIAVETFSVSADPVCFSLCTGCPVVVPGCTNPDLVICDNFDGYDLGSVSDQNPIWIPWPGGTSAPVSDDFAQSGDNSLHIFSEGSLDQVLLFPANVTSGNYTARWSFYIPDGAGAYFNLQGDQNDIGGTFKMECVMDPSGAGSVNAGGADAATFSFPTGEWFDVVHYIDFDNDWIQLVIDGELVYQWAVSDDSAAPGGTAQIGAVNFYPINADYDFYIDDVEVVAVTPCADESIICDPLETYFVGTLGNQSGWWTTWSGTEGGDEDGVVTNMLSSAGGEKSLALAGGNGQDVLLLLGNRTEGNYRLAFDMYMAAGNTGYYNVQEDETPAVQWNIETFFDGPDAGSIVIDQAEVATFSYTEDAWISVENLIDVDNSTISVLIDGTEVYSGEYIGDQIGSVNFYPADASAIYNVDNVNFSALDPIVVEPDPVDVTLTVNTKFQDEVSADGMFIAGEFSGWENVAMTDNGDQTWSVTVTAPANDTLEYKFKNGPDGWEEGVPGDCTINGNDGQNRFFVTEEANLDVAVVCFDACVDCDATSVIDLGFDAAISVAPNPTQGVFTVAYNLENASDLSMRVSNILGQVLVDRQVDAATAGTEAFDLTDMPAGTYNLVVTDGTRLSTKRIIVE